MNKYITAIQEVNDYYNDKLDDLSLGTIDALDKLLINYKTLLNEFCYRCGNYKTEHLGSCKNCRWKEEKYD